MMGGNRLIVLDTETTLKWPQTAKVLEVAAVVVDGGEIRPEYFHSMCNPGVEDSPGLEDALAVNGITRGEIEAAPREAEVVAGFKDFILSQGETLLTSYNTWYDRTVLERNGWLPRDAKWGKCIMLGATKIMGRAGAVPYDRRKGDYKWASLREAALYFDVGAPPTHRALDDALAAAEIWLKIAGILGGPR